LIRALTPESQSALESTSLRFALPGGRGRPRSKPTASPVIENDSLVSVTTQARTSTVRLLVCLAMMAATFPAAVAHAEDKPVPTVGEVFSPSYSGLGGLFVYGGIAAWPKQTGLAISLGLFHQHRFGFDLNLNVPLVKREGTNDPFILSGLAGRLAILREGLSDTWTEGHTPKVGLIVGLRLGVGVLGNAGNSGPPIGLLAGPSFELVLGRTFLVGLRPSVAVRTVKTGDDSNTSKLQALPMVDFSIGWVPEAAYPH
jgi:hypothetical protein